MKECPLCGSMEHVELSPSEEAFYWSVSENGHGWAWASCSECNIEVFSCACDDLYTAKKDAERKWDSLKR